MNDSAPLHTAGERSPGYDTIVTRQAGEDRQTLMARAMRGAELDQDKAETLVNWLLIYGSAKVKSGVSLAVAEEVAERFAKAGFIAEATPVLALSDATITIDCPACLSNIQPTPQNQCPKCGVFLHKLTPEILERKRIEREEQRKLQIRNSRNAQESRMALAAEQERRLREQVRARLEKRQGKGGSLSLWNYRYWLLALAAVAMGTTAEMGRIRAFVANWTTPADETPTEMMQKPEAKLTGKLLQERAQEDSVLIAAALAGKLPRGDAPGESPSPGTGVSGGTGDQTAVTASFAGGRNPNELMQQAPTGAGA